MTNLMKGGNQVCTVSNNVSVNDASVNSIEEVKNAIDKACYGYFHFSLGMFDSLKVYSTDKEFLNSLPVEFEIRNENTETDEPFLCEANEQGEIRVSRPKDVVKSNIEVIFKRFTNVEPDDNATYNVKLIMPYFNEINEILEWMKSNNISFFNKGSIDKIIKFKSDDVSLDEYGIFLVILN